LKNLLVNNYLFLDILFEEKRVNMKKTIIIDGMSCMNCVKHVKEALSELSGVNSVDVDLSTKTAVIESTVDINDSEIRNIIDEYGYEVKEIK